jgi:hypothetical protein
MTSSPLPTPSPLANKYLRYFLSFFVTLAVGLSPLLISNVPGLKTILDLFPSDLQDVIPWASMLMSVTAVGVQFFGGDTSTARRLAPAFIVTFVLLVPSIFVLYFQYKTTVIRVQVPGAKTKVAYLVGSTLLPACECAKHGLQIRECIGREISANPEEVEACYPLHEITTRANVLSGLYMFVMFSLGILIGLVVLRESLPKPEVITPKPQS